MTLAQPFEAVLAKFRTLSNPRALQVVAVLAQGPCTVEALVQATGQRPPEVRRILSLMGEAELIVPAKIDGVYRYTLQADRLQALPHAILHMTAPSTPTTAPTPEDFESKTLHDFIEAGRLKSIPATDKKRQVILRYLANLFVPGRRYPEREVNAMLQDVHPDSASLRRYLVDSHLMARDHGIYWRLDSVESGVLRTED